eukprot:96089-Pleurochrysis_carterae.AAC.1
MAHGACFPALFTPQMIHSVQYFGNQTKVRTNAFACTRTCVPARAHARAHAPRLRVSACAHPSVVHARESVCALATVSTATLSLSCCTVLLHSSLTVAINLSLNQRFRHTAMIWQHRFDAFEHGQALPSFPVVILLRTAFFAPFRICGSSSVPSF